MAESRILDYDGTYVTFWYQRHEDDLIVIERVHAFEFISRIIVHIPDFNFKQIRFYGAYHNSTKVNCHVVKFIHPDKVNFYKHLSKWKNLIRISFRFNPLICPLCNSFMVYNTSVYT